MLKNRSVPANVLLPHITYQSVAEAMAWLGKAFGFVENYRYGDPENPSGAQMHLGEAWMMLRSAAAGWTGAGWAGDPTANAGAGRDSIRRSRTVSRIKSCTKD